MNTVIANMATIVIAAVAMAVSGVKIPAGALVDLPVGVAVRLGVGVRAVGVEARNDRENEMLGCCVSTAASEYFRARSLLVYLCCIGW